MADRPLSAPLPADLPEDWADGQIVAPSGASVGLSEQHGYNYLMKMVNRAHKAVNTINEGFDNISGKRTCRFVVGTSMAGWTQADCDYLCDGADDQVEIQTAVDAAPFGSEIVILSGTYNITAPIKIDKALILCGSGASSTILSIREGAFLGENHTAITASGDLEIQDMELNSFLVQKDLQQVLLGLSGNNNYYVNRVLFSSAFDQKASLAASGSSSTLLCVSECRFYIAGASKTAISVNSNGGRTALYNNTIEAIGGAINISGSTALIEGTFCSLPVHITLDDIRRNSLISNNNIHKLTLLNTPGGNNGGVFVAGNTFNDTTADSEDSVCIEIGDGVYYTTVIGNSFFSTVDGTQRHVQDNGIGSVIRFNSDDTGSGSGAAGVSSFKGRTGAVNPASGDYTAAMVGAIPSGDVAAVQAVTQAEYDALTQKDPATLYLIQG